MRDNLIIYKLVEYFNFLTNTNFNKKRLSVNFHFREIYDIFSVIGEDKIRRVKSFTASSFSDLTTVRPRYTDIRYTDILLKT